MQKTRKIISMLLAVMMIFSMCAVGMASASALPENAVISDVEGNDASGIDGEVFGLMGDADGNGEINIKDATEIQKFAAKIIELDEKCEALADVDLNDKVNVKDATAIQKWIADIPVDMPVGKLVYFPNQSTTESIPTTTAASVDETVPTTTALSSPDETEPESTAPSVPVIVIIPTDATDPSESATASDNTEVTQPSSGAQATTASDNVTTAATTTAAATTVPALKSVTVYFTNNLNWTVVNVHAWNGDGDLTTWPGVAMTFYKTNSQGQDVYKYTFYDDVDGVVFNGFADPNNTKDKSLQTASIKGDAFKGDGYGYWCTGEKDSGGKQLVDSYKVEDQQTTTTASVATGDETTIVSQATTASQPAKTLTVYFTNNLNWTVVNVHAWNSSGNLTTFPGVAMTFYRTNSQGQDIYKYTFDTDDVDGVVFNGYDDPENTDDKALQTTSIKGDDFKGDGYGYWCIGDKDSKGRQLVSSYKVEEQQTTSVASGDESTTVAPTTTVAATTTQATTTATEPAGPITVYFTNKCGWNVVNIHCWNSTETLTVWPGVRMSYYSVNQYGQTTYTFEVPAGTESIGFNGYTDPNYTSDKEIQTITITGSDLKDGYGYYPIRRGDDGRWLVESWDEEHLEQATTAAPTTTAAVTTVAPTTTVAATTVAPTTSVDTVTITFNGAKTTWINNADAYFVLVDLDTNESYNMTNIGNYKWTAEVPETVNNVKFERHNPDITATKPVWNSWTANDRGTSLQYNASSSSAGAWEGDTTVKYYVMGSFNSWSAGTPMTANADGTYTQTIALEAGNYQYKIATADYSVEYPSGYGNNATLTVATAGNYKFTLSASGQITAVAV